MTSTTDANGTVSGVSYDGFGRQTLAKITQPGGSEGILLSTSYAGFELNSPVGRSIVQKIFPDAVTSVTAPGRISTTYLDNLGRTIKTETQLGSDYQNKTGVVGQRIYDPLGRVKFEADPFLSTDSFETAYGTTYNYNTDGTPSCFVRGPGTQPVTFSVNETTEVYPTCFNHGFLNSQEFQDRGESELVPGRQQSSVQFHQDHAQRHGPGAGTRHAA